MAGEQTERGEIIVTGERVDRSILDTLSSVTVVTDDEAKRSGQRGVYETIIGAPNITPAPGEFLPPIRGDETGGPGGLFGGVLFGTQPRATLIVDDVQRLSTGANNSATSIFDIAQIEVLRGPQTTLRGANAISGAFLIVTNRPSDRIEAAAFGEYADNEFVDATYRVAGMVNLPITDGVSARFTAERIDGSVPIIVQPYDPFDPTNPPLLPGDDFEDISRFEKDRFRGQLLIAPPSLAGFELLIQGEYEDGVDPGFDSFVNSPDFFVNQTAGGFPEVTSVKDRVFGFPNPRIFDTRLRFASGNAAYDFGSGVTLRAITSYQDSLIVENKRNTDLFVDFDRIEEDRFTQDLLLTFGEDGDTVRGLIGGTLNRGNAFNLLSGFDFDTRGNRDSEALFADLTVRLGERLNLMAGGRLNHSRVTQIADAFGTLSAIDFKEDRTDFLPKIGLSYSIGADATLAATARRGFNAGGAGIDFFDFGTYEWRAETVWTYEAAYRQRFGRRLSLGVTGFYSDYDNKQFFITSEINPASTKVSNLPGSISYGIELDARAELTPRLSATAGIGLLETKITTPPADGPSLDGNDVGTDPPFTGSLALIWTPLEGLELSGKVVHVAEYDSFVENDPAERAGDYTLVDLGIAYRRGPLTARAFVSNVFDEFAVYQTLSDSGVYVNPPRTFGFSLEARF